MSLARTIAALAATVFGASGSAHSSGLVPDPGASAGTSKFLREDSTWAVPSLIPSGLVASFAMSAAPSGWLECDGSAVSRTTYAALFSAIGTTYGTGDGSTTFNLPDLRGEFLRGWDHGRGVDSGRAIGTSQAAAIGPHSHNANGLTNRNTVSGGTDQLVIKNGTANGISDAVNNSGTGIGTETRPRNIAMMFCIKT